MGKDQGKNLDKVPSNSELEQPTPKVIPYDADFAGDSSAATNQLRMKLSNTLKTKESKNNQLNQSNTIVPPFTEEVNESLVLPQIPPPVANTKVENR